MKKISLSFILFFCLIKSSFAGILSPLADTFITLELSKSVLSKNQINADFKNSNTMLESLRQFEDIAIGGNIRFGKFIGFNVNWSQTNLKNNAVNGVSQLQNSARYKSDQINYTTLLYLPLITKRAELFLEGGLVDIGSKLKYTRSGGVDVEKKSNDTMFIYGLGAQISPLGGDFIRLTVLRYAGKIGLLETNYTTVRLGYLKSF